jgi:tripartite-type tricarboxylate transporter receptor subunit TctC
VFCRMSTALACLIALAFCGAAAGAQPYPSRPIRLVLGVGTGGVGDVSMRLAAQQMSKGLGQTIVVDNRPSAGGIAAALAVVKANPDGYTILQTGNAAAISASLFKKLPYDVRKDFVQVSTVAIFQLALVATPNSGLGSPADVIAFAKKNPGKLNIGTINVGSTQFLAAELFKSMAGIEAQVVPFKSNTLLIAALRGNELPVSFELLGPVLAHIKTGTLRVLAVGSERRFASLPDVPTLAESWVPGYNVASWTGMSVPAGTPRAIVERLSREAVAATAAPEVRQPLLEMGIEARGSTPDDTRKLMNAEIAKWHAVIERAGIERQ